MARRKESVSADRRIPFPPEEVWGLVSDAARQPEWIPGPDTGWSSCKVKHASGPLAGEGARHIRVLEDTEGNQSVDRLETVAFEEARHIAFSDGRSFTVQPEAQGTLLTCAHEAVLSSGLGRMARRAFRSEPELLGPEALDADLARIERALAAEAQNGGSPG